MNNEDTLRPEYPVDLIQSGERGKYVMTVISEIEVAVAQLSRKDLSVFRDWFRKFDAEAWDKQFEHDVAAGRLDALAEEALRDLREGRCTDLFFHRHQSA